MKIILGLILLHTNAEDLKIEITKVLKFIHYKNAKIRHKFVKIFVIDDSLPQRYYRNSSISKLNTKATVV